MSLSRFPVWQVITAVVLLAFAAIAGWYYYRISNRIVWTMIHVSGNRYSGDAHLLEFPNGHVVLVDTGFDRFTRSHLIPYLDNRGVRRIDQLIITHAHRNHYGGIHSLMQHLDGIGEIYFNMPPKVPCDKETWSTGCNYRHVLHTRALIEDSGIPIQTLATDDLLYHNQDHDITLETVYVHDGESEPVGLTSINDTSAVLRLVYGETTALFTGDINRKVGKHLLDSNFFLKSDIVTAPHHGVDGAASNRFLRGVDPKVMLVSNSERHWRGKRGDRMRQFANDNGIHTYVTGTHGNVVVILKRDDYYIRTQREPPDN